MKKETIVEVVNKLIGDISPKGCSSRDKVVLDNIEVLGEVVCYLAQELQYTKRNITSYESSVKECGKKADYYLRELKGIIDDEEI